MAQIIYKEGRKGYKDLKDIEGIEINLLNGQKALIYPRYEEKALLLSNQYCGVDMETISDIEALKRDDNCWPTEKLLECGSPAAKYTRRFHSDKYGAFGLPTLLAAMEIKDQESDIDALAMTIRRADLLMNFHPALWSCCRNFSTIKKYSYEKSLDFCYDPQIELTVIPVLLYR